ncbi:MAG: hypothetical protein FJX15_11850 [Alphaproteobacteria bacterium]|nr:hypothetical protein [Alphaproteobacteria bacterium]
MLTVVAVLLFGAAAAVSRRDALLAERGRGTLFSDLLRGAIDAVGQIVTETFAASPLFDVQFIGMSLKALYEFALLMERRTVGGLTVSAHLS